MRLREQYKILRDAFERLKKHFFSSNKNYWYDILREHGDDLVKKGFKFNSIGELGLQISLTDEEVKDIDFMSDKSTRDIAAYKIFRLKLAEFLNKNQDFFLTTGILELVATEDYVVEKSTVDDYTYHVYITYSFGKYNFKFWFLCSLIILTIALKIYFSLV